MSQRRSHMPAYVLAMVGIVSGIVVRHVTQMDQMWAAAVFPATGGVLGATIGLLMSGRSNRTSRQP
ncbi:MAG: hypothetical protein KDA85_08345 [Planctomycetaceae bacterium]|nr:hypothetical protein [Planctomycetaceae bacterium]